MTKWICQIDNQEYNSEEAVRDAVNEYICTYDFEQVIGANETITLDDIIKELQRLDSPLYYKLLEEIEERIFQDYFYEVSDDEEEDNDIPDIDEDC